MSLVYFSSVFSTLFRLASYVFLRIVPTRLAQPILPFLFVAYLISSWLWPAKAPLPSSIIRPTDKIKTHEPTTNGPPFAPPNFALLSSNHLPPTFLGNLFLNLVLLLFSLDLALTPFFDSAEDVTFTRIGAVSPDSAKIVVRYPPNSAEETFNEILLTWREIRAPGEEMDWSNGPLVNLTADTDWTQTIKLSNLWPSNDYEFLLSTPDGIFLPYPTHPIRFRTFPDPRLQNGNHFRFLVSSCITPNFPYAGPLNKRTIKGFDLLADYLFPTPPKPEANPVVAAFDVEADVSEEEKLKEVGQPKVSPLAAFLLFLGDFIYADVPLYVGDDKEAYRRLYRRNYNSPSFRKIYERLRMSPFYPSLSLFDGLTLFSEAIFHTYDDHEIINNYGGASTDAPPFPNADDAFSIYNALANPDPTTPNQHYYTFAYGDTSFFVLDTRRNRSDIATTAAEERTMLGEVQLAALYDWLSRVNRTSTFKFIVSSVPFTSLWQHDAQTDSWAGFPSEKSALLETLHTVPNVFILSGDRHEFASIEFNPSDENKHVVMEFSTSPLNMFYIPIIHTLLPRSTQLVNRTNVEIVKDVGGEEIVITTVDTIPQERVVKYIPEGNSKWSTIEIDTTNSSSPKLRLETIIDGKHAYTYEHVGTPVKLAPSTALGAFVPSSVKGIFDKIGINPNKWF
ncbi:PhoD-like phosphatase-domain-containing protein [Cyathus striatus]|nr:PhoD-like phosphatase-domain-containing protein [Cyathus striatus]